MEIFRSLFLILSVEVIFLSNIIFQCTGVPMRKSISAMITNGNNLSNNIMGSTTQLFLGFIHSLIIPQHVLTPVGSSSSGGYCIFKDTIDCEE
jgi:hypothetical protein